MSAIRILLDALEGSKAAGVDPALKKAIVTAESQIQEDEAKIADLEARVGKLETRGPVPLTSPVTITVSPSELPAGVVGQPYNQALIPSGGTAPYVFDVEPDSVPDGLVVNPDGTITGTPTGGDATFVIDVTDFNGVKASVGYTIPVSGAAIEPVAQPVAQPEPEPEPIPADVAGQSGLSEGSADPALTETGAEA